MIWQKIIAELEAKGLTQSEIAEKCDVSQPYVSQLKTGKRHQVNHTVGEALKALHKKSANRIPAERPQ